VNEHKDFPVLFSKNSDGSINSWLADGYEGCMARNMDSPYEQDKRSYNLQELKEFENDEFPVVDVKEGRGKMKGLAIFTCVIGDDMFDVKMEGDLENLRQYIEHPELAVGKLLTVRYQGFTVYGKPRFPVGKCIRDYE
jgi:DNA ligase-1